MGTTESLSSVGKLLRTKLDWALQQENAAEKLKNSHETQRTAPETHHIFKPLKP